MRRAPLFRILTIMTAILISSCSRGSKSSSFDSSSENELKSSSLSSSSLESSSALTSSSEMRVSSSIKEESSSSLVSSSSKEVSSSNISSSSAISSSSQANSSSNQASSSSSNKPSSSSVSSSSSEHSSSSSQPISSSSHISSSSSTSSSSSHSSSSVPSSSMSSSSSSSPSSSGSSSSSQPQSTDPLANYNVISTFAKRMPGEFEPASMIKMCYPNNMPLDVYKTIAKDNKVLLLVNPSNNGSSRIEGARSALIGAGVDVNNVTFLDMPIDDDYGYWVRDFSPFYVFNNKSLSIVDFNYNRPQRVEQNAVPAQLATYFNMSYSKMNLTHTGGNLMQDGRGTAFSDDLVVSENNNDKTIVRRRMNASTGTESYVITIDPQGDYIAHIDCWAKIVAPDKIIVARLPKSNSRYDYYEQVAEQLGKCKCAYGYNYRIYRIDEPGGSVVAPYTNSLIANGHVYMPLGSNTTYNNQALEVYREALPGYDVVGVKGFSSGGNVFLNTDALHCRTHEVPDQNMVFIDSREVYNGTVELQENYVIKANVVSYSDEALKGVNIHYSINDGEYITKTMRQYQETTNYTYVFEGLQSGDDVKYYIDASDTLNNYNVDPTCGKLDPHHFSVE